MKAVLNEQQGINPFFITMDGEKVPAIRFVSLETQAMMDAGYLRQHSFDAVVRQADIIAFDVAQPQINDEVAVIDDLNPSKAQPFTLKKAKSDTLGVEWTYTFEIKV